MEATYVQWATLAGMGGLAIYSLKGYIKERTKSRRASDLPVTMGEMNTRFEKENEKTGGIVKLEISHVRELVEKDLAHGKERFDRIDSQIGDMGREMKAHGLALSAIGTDIKEFAKAAATRNGGSGDV